MDARSSKTCKRGFARGAPSTNADPVKLRDAFGPTRCVVTFPTAQCKSSRDARSTSITVITAPRVPSSASSAISSTRGRLSVPARRTTSIAAAAGSRASGP